MKKIIVTGGAGFIGSEVVKQLLEKGYFVRVADNLSKKESKIRADCDFVKADLSDKKAALAAFEGMDICINLAAKIGGIGYFHKYPATILSENNKIYSATFEAAVAHKLERLVYISSSMVFESASRFPSREEDVKRIPPPVSAYGLSKLIGENYCQAFWDEFRLPFSICRPFNAYGINEYPGEEVGYAHVIPDLIKKALLGQSPLEILGDGQQIRCFTHVRDLAAGIIAVMENPKAHNEDFNIANPEPFKMLDLAKIIWQKINPDKPFLVKHLAGFPYDIKKRLPDTSKAKRVLQWEAQVRFADGLDEVITWLSREYDKK